MKRLFIGILLLGFTSHSQSIESLKTASKKLYEANYLMDFEAVAALTYPKVYEEKGKDDFIASSDLKYQNNEYRVRLQLETVPLQMGAIKKMEGKSFCVIRCRNPLRYFFETKLNTETAAEKAVWLKEINKTKEVTFEPNRNSFNVKKTTTYIAVSDESTFQEWKFFNFDDVDQFKMFQKLFGESIQKELGL